MLYVNTTASEQQVYCYCSNEPSTVSVLGSLYKIGIIKEDNKLKNVIVSPQICQFNVIK